MVCIIFIKLANEKKHQIGLQRRIVSVSATYSKKSQLNWVIVFVAEILDFYTTIILFY